MLACPLFLKLKTIAALVNYSGAPSARVAPYLRKLVIHLSEKFGNRVTVSPYVRKDPEGKRGDSGVSLSGGGEEEYVIAEVPALPVYVRIVWPPSLILS